MEPASIFVYSEKDLPVAVEQILQYAGKRKKFALSGDLGAGKTAFVKAFCHRFNAGERVTSPTFSLVNEYTFGKKGETLTIHHLDLYRLKSLQEALDIGIEEFLYDENYCLIEWPELVEALLPEDTVRINISIVNATTRKILFL